MISAPSPSLGTPHAVPGSAPRPRRRRNRPPTVPLAEFGKQPLVPPHPPIDWRALTRNAVIVGLVLLLLAWGVAAVTGRSEQLWDQARYLDQRQTR